MTKQKSFPASSTSKVQSSLSCVADASALMRVRILPAEFARLLGVSKQAVSRWIAAGKVTISPIDGRLDVQTAVQQVLRNTDPGRMRARVLRHAIADLQAPGGVADVDARVASIEAELGAKITAAERQLEHMTRYASDVDCMFDRVLDLVRESELALRATASTDEWLELVDRIESAAAEACDPDGCSLADALDAFQERAAATTEGGGVE